MPPEEQSQKQRRLLLDTSPEKTSDNKDKGIVSAGNWSGVGLDIGPEISRIEDPAKRTADATEQTAEAVRQLVAKGGVVSDLHDNQRSELVDRVTSLKKDIVGLAMNGGDQAQAKLQAKMAQLKEAEKDLTALDAFRGFKTADPQAIAAAAADSNMSATDLLEKIALGEFSKSRFTPQLAAPPAIAIDTVAPRAPEVQAVAAQGTQTAMANSGTGIDFRQIGSDIVEAVREGTNVSRSILGVLTGIAAKPRTEAVFQ
jgi:hypothetical protein